MDGLTHAPYAIIGDFGIIIGNTVKTACGKRRPVDKVKPRGEQSCQECQTVIERDRQEAAELHRVARELGIMNGTNEEDV